jgi:hypothetical protein
VKSDRVAERLENGFEGEARKKGRDGKISARLYHQRSRREGCLAKGSIVEAGGMCQQKFNKKISEPDRLAYNLARAAERFEAAHFSPVDEEIPMARSRGTPPNKPARSAPARRNKTYDRPTRAFVEVPAKYAGPVLSLIETLLEPENEDVAKRLEALRALNGTVLTGVVVTNVGPESQGAKAGMKRGDLLLQYDDKEIGSFEVLKELAETTNPDQKVIIAATRGAQKMRFAVRGGRLGITAASMSSSARTKH